MTPHLYIHVPFCDGKCHYCGFYSVSAAPSLTGMYCDLPAQELACLCQTHPLLRHTPPKTIYMGGGTPAMLGPDGLRRLYGALARLVPLAAAEEWTVELNPQTVTPALLEALRDIGVNRLTVGIQILDDATLNRIGRRHNAETAVQAVRMAQDAGFRNIGIDLIAGLPGCTESMWDDTLHRAAGLNVQHVSVYALTLEPETPLAAQVKQGLALPDDDAQLSALAQAESLLAANGFARYEISNYARPGHECQHNLGIWRGNDYIGLGPSAASRLGRLRWTNNEELSEYIDAGRQSQRPPHTGETLSELDDALERTLFALRLHEGLDLDANTRRFPALGAHAAGWHARLQRLAREGITEQAGGRWRLTPRGREVCDAVLAELV